MNKILYLHLFFFIISILIQSKKNSIFNKKYLFNYKNEKYKNKTIFWM